MDYSSKYLKYKSKYASLKISRMAGGMNYTLDEVSQIIDCYENSIFTHSNRTYILDKLENIKKSFEVLFNKTTVAYYFPPRPDGKTWTHLQLYKEIANNTYGQIIKLQELSKQTSPKVSKYNFNYVKPFWWGDNELINKNIGEDLKTLHWYLNRKFFSEIIQPIQVLKLPELSYDNEEITNYIKNELSICYLLLKYNDIVTKQEQSDIQQNKSDIETTLTQHYPLTISNSVKINQSLNKNTENKLNKQMLHLVFVIYCFHLILFFFIRYYYIIKYLEPPTFVSKVKGLFKHFTLSKPNPSDLENKKLLERLNTLFEEIIKNFIQPLIEKIYVIMLKCNFNISEILMPIFSEPEDSVSMKEIANIWKLNETSLSTIIKKVSNLLSKEVQYKILDFNYLFTDKEPLAKEITNIIIFIKTKLLINDHIKALFDILSRLINIHCIWNFPYTTKTQSEARYAPPDPDLDEY